VALGWTALARIHREAPHVLLLHPDLPDMDAFEVCRRASADAAIPVVVLLPPSQHAAAPAWALAGASAIAPFPAAGDLDALDALVQRLDAATLDPSRARNQFLLTLYRGVPHLGAAAGFRCAAPSPDGRLLAVATEDFVLRFRDANSGALQRQVDTSPYWLSCLAWSPDGRALAAGTLDGAILLCSPDADGSRSLLGHSAAVARLAWSPDGRVLTSTSAAASVRRWDPFSGALLPPRPPRPPLAVPLAPS
jgi:CheY-like chemotaxis protein